jgi:hypothetical protein
LHNNSSEQISGADGVKIAVLRKGLASLEFIRAAAHRKRWALERIKYHARITISKLANYQQI